LPLNFDQVFELVNQLPKHQKKRLANLLLEKESSGFVDIPDVQKNFVRTSIKKYKKHPGLLINDGDAWKMVDAK
jgi:hypothetical protein